MVTSASLLLVGIFQRTWADVVLSPWPGQNHITPGAQLQEDWFWRGLVYMWGGGIQASRLFLTGSPGA